jgi:cytochrome c
MTQPAGRATRKKTLAVVALIAGFVLWSHLGSGVPVFRSEVASEPGWDKFRTDYRISHFGDDGQFVRAVQNGYNLVFYTYKYAPRFTRKTAGDRVNSCAACHTAQDLAYSFVNSDRFEAQLGKRLSFEDRVRWCYAGPMDGFVPTLYDPAVRDIRLFARAVAHHLQLTEGALRTDD